MEIYSKRHHQQYVSIALIIEMFGRVIWSHGVLKLSNLALIIKFLVPGTQ
jgi:hypothetical protein